MAVEVVVRPLAAAEDLLDRLPFLELDEAGNARALRLPGYFSLVDERQLADVFADLVALERRNPEAVVALFDFLAGFRHGHQLDRAVGSHFALPLFELGRKRRADL